jgi:hypothetical protein
MSGAKEKMMKTSSLPPAETATITASPITKQAFPEMVQFQKWCTDRLGGATALDVPTFISFLLELKSSKEINDYIIECLAEEPSIDADQFATGFIHRRVQLKTIQPLIDRAVVEDSYHVVGKKHKPATTTH